MAGDPNVAFSDCLDAAIKDIGCQHVELNTLLANQWRSKGAVPYADDLKVFLRNLELLMKKYRIQQSDEFISVRKEVNEVGEGQAAIYYKPIIQRVFTDASSQLKGLSARMRP